MKYTRATKLTAAAMTAALLVTLVPAPALAEAAHHGTGDEAAITVVDDQTACDQDQPQNAIEVAEPATEATPNDESASSEDESTLDEADPVLLFAQASDDDKGWTTEDTKKLANVLLNASRIGIDIASIFLGAGNPALMIGGANTLVSDLMGWMGLGASTGPTTSDVMDGLNSVQYRLASMDRRLADVEYGVNIANVRSLIENANDLSTYCSEVEGMFDANHLSRLGLAPLPKDATSEQESQWREDVVQAVLAAEQNRTNGFIQYESDMAHIKQLFIRVANIAGQSNITSPIPVWDSMWENYYNWETEAWGPKQALRTSITSSLSRAYGLLAMYLRIYENPDHVETTLTTLLQRALKQVNSMNAGTNPATLDLDKGGFSVRCYTLNKCATRWKATCYVNEGISGISDANIRDYLSRLHGHTVLEDLQLAGLAYDLEASGNNAITRHYSTKRAGDRGSAGLPVVGLAYWGDWSNDGGYYDASMLLWDGSASNKTTVSGTNTQKGTYFIDLGLK